MNRRDVLKLSAAAAVGAAMPPAQARARVPAAAAHRTRSDAVRNIIFMVSDGMSASVPGLAEAFSQLVRGRGTNWVNLARQSSTVQGWFDMTSRDSLVSDSAAAASAWGSGHRVNNNAVNMLPDGTRLTPICVSAHDAGMRVGLVTTTRLTHATPAGFAASVPKRSLEDDIAGRYLDVVDVLMGGGRRHFDHALRKDHRDLLGEFQQHGYAMCSTREELLAPHDHERVLALFAANHLPYTIDRNREPQQQRNVPTLAEMTAGALKMLAKSRRGFLLQVEGGRVDHAAHNNDAAAMLWDQLAFDDAIGAVMEFCQEHADTLVVITSDHGCGNPGLNGFGVQYEASNSYFERLKRASASLEAMQARWSDMRNTPDAQRDAAAMVDLLQWGTGLNIDPSQAQTIVDVLNGEPAPELNHLEANIYGVVGQIVGNHTGIAWTGIAHTADWTPVLAFGPQRERFAGLCQNTDAYMHMCEAAHIAAAQRHDD